MEPPLSPHLSLRNVWFCFFQNFLCLFIFWLVIILFLLFFPFFYPDKKSKKHINDNKYQKLNEISPWHHICCVGIWAYYLWGWPWGWLPEQSQAQSKVIVLFLFLQNKFWGVQNSKLALGNYVFRYTISILQLYFILLFIVSFK